MIKFELTPEEFQALAGLLDAGVRAVGIRGVKEAAMLLVKMEQAQAEAATAQTSNGVADNHLSA